jgi:glycosyltransferase involved in cell wall biosynthesis
MRESRFTEVQLDDNRPMVSVILPVFNRLDTLPEAMRSVLDQSFSDLELIVSDDASNEDVEAVVRAVGDRRVRYIRRHVNGGAAAARNTGVAAARGRYLAFQDSDDLWLPGKLERQVALLEQQPAEVGGVTGAKILYGRDNRYLYGVGKVAYAPTAGQWMTLEEDQLRRSLLENRISLQNALFRRDCLPPEPLFDDLSRANEDWGFTVRLTQATKVLEDRDPVVFSYITPGSVSQNMHRTALGTLRILQMNRCVYKRYPAEHGRMLYKIGAQLIEVGHPRMGWRLIWASVRSRPANSVRLAGKLAKDLAGRVIALFFGLHSREDRGRYGQGSQSINDHQGDADGW